MLRNGRLETNSKTITDYIWNVIDDSYSEENNEVIRVLMTFYDMNSQSNTSIIFSNNKDFPYDYLSYKFRTLGLISKELLGSFIEQILLQGNKIDKFEYNNYDINLSFSNICNTDLKYKRIIVDLSFPTQMSSSILQKEYIIYLFEKFSEEMKNVFPENKRRTFTREYQQQLFFCSLKHKDLLKVIDYICDDDLSYLLSHISKDRFTFINEQLASEKNSYKLTRSKAI